MKWFKKIIYIIISIIILSICVNMFLAPHDIAAGGITGLSIILEELYSLDRSMVILISNIFILIITFIFLGKEIFLNTLIGSLLLPLFIGIIPHTMLIEDALLSMFFGSIFFGVAVSILYQNKASSGGTAVPPLIFKKYFNMNPSIGLFLTDGIVVILCLFVFTTDAFFLAITSIFITSVTMNYIKTGIRKKKLIYIISDKRELILNDILYVINKGVTLIPIKGAYKKHSSSMLMVTLDSKYYQRLVDIVNKHDKKAFMITDNVSDVHGEGFTYESGSI